MQVGVLSRDLTSTIFIFYNLLLFNKNNTAIPDCVSYKATHTAFKLVDVYVMFRVNYANDAEVKQTRSWVWVSYIRKACIWAHDLGGAWKVVAVSRMRVKKFL